MTQADILHALVILVFAGLVAGITLYLRNPERVERACRRLYGIGRD